MERNELLVLSEEAHESLFGCLRRVSGSFVWNCEGSLGFTSHIVKLLKNDCYPHELTVCYSCFFLRKVKYTS